MPELLENRAAISAVGRAEWWCGLPIVLAYRQDTRRIILSGDCWITGSGLLDHWKWIVDNHKAIERLARRSCRECYEMVDELVEVAYDRAPGIIDRWDASRGVELRAYVFCSLRWWMFKHMNKEAARVERLEELDEDDHKVVDRVDLIDQEEVYKGLESLSEYERTIVKLYHEGYTWKEMAVLCNVPRTSLMRDYWRAIGRMRHAFR